MKLYEIAVYWEVGTTVFIRAESLDAALTFAEGTMPLPAGAEYVDGSFTAPEECASEVSPKKAELLDVTEILNVTEILDAAEPIDDGTRSAE